MSQPKAEQAFFQLLRLSLGREEDFPSGLTGEERQAGVILHRLGSCLGAKFLKDGLLWLTDTSHAEACLDLRSGCPQNGSGWGGRGCCRNRTKSRSRGTQISFKRFTFFLLEKKM